MLASLTEAALVVTRNTPMGWLAVVTQGDTLLAVTFAHATPQAALRSLPSTVMDQYSHSAEPQAKKITSSPTPLARRLERFLAGRTDDLRDIKLDESWCTAFQKAVIQAVRNIPLGETRTYGQIAASVGSPRAARAVGTIMAQNRTPLVVPCHRVVSSTGLGGFSARGGLRTKLRLLETESASSSKKRDSIPKSNATRRSRPK